MTDQATTARTPRSTVSSISERRTLTLKDFHPAGRATVLKLAKGDRTRIEVLSPVEAIVR